jgi:ligand-binding SRPBCC domain-containing protein
MRTVRFRSLISTPAEELFNWHSRPGAFERLVPPWQNVEIAFREGSIHDGDRLAMDIKAGPFHKRWLALHTDYLEDEQFRDTQIEGPFAHWVHTHRVHPAGAEASVLDDRIEYELPGGRAAAALGGAFAAQQIRRMFRFRHLRTRNDLIRHQRYRDRERVRVAIVGSGQLVAQLSAFLSGGGHAVVENRPFDFVVDLSHLFGQNPTSRVYLRSEATWVTVLPVSASSFSTLRFPRNVTIWTPSIAGSGPSNPFSRIAGAIQGGFRKLDDDKQIPWLAEDDLFGAIHSVMMERVVSEEIMARAPTLASAREIQRVTGRAPMEGITDVPEGGFQYLYPTLDIATSALNGRLLPS